MALTLLLATGMDWPFPARLAQAFAGLGAAVDAVCPTASPLRQAAGLRRLHGFSFADPLRALDRALDRAAPDLVIPCDDLTAELLWRLGRRRPERTALWRRSFGDPDAFPVLAGRNAFLAAAEAEGVGVAQTVPVARARDLDAAAARLGFPLVLKADGSWGGDGVAIVRDPAAAGAAFARLARSGRLRTLVRALRRGEPHLLVRARFPAQLAIGAQRFVNGHPATSSLACWEGQVLAANHFDVAVSAGTGPATVVAPVASAQMDRAARRLAARFGLSGFYGLDYMRDGDGEVFLLEINPRATPTSHLALGPGHDLAAAFLTAAGQAAPDRPAVTARSRIALFPQELRRDPKSPHLAAAHHDLPLDAGLLAALMPAPLTSFSQPFSGLEALMPPSGAPRR